jgi:hypothetical protein
MFASGKPQHHVCFRDAPASFLLQGIDSFMFASGKWQLHVCFREAAASCLLQGSGSCMIGKEKCKGMIEKRN